MIIFILLTGDDCGVLALALCAIPLAQPTVETIAENIFHSARIPLATAGRGHRLAVEALCNGAQALACCEVGKDALHCLCLALHSLVLCSPSKVWGEAPIRAALLGFLALAIHDPFGDLAGLKLCDGGKHSQGKLSVWVLVSNDSFISTRSQPMACRCSTVPKKSLVLRARRSSLIETIRVINPSWAAFNIDW